MKNLLKRPWVFVYAAFAVAIVGAFSFTQFSSHAGPSYDAEWDLPIHKSDKTLHSYGMDGPLTYRGWPHEYDSYAPSQAPRVRVARVPLPPVRPVHLVQVHKPIEHPATLTIGQAMMSVVCRYVGAGSILCRKSVG